MTPVHVVTGGAGFIGSNLVEALLEQGHSVRLLDNFSTGRSENISGLVARHGAQLEVVNGDIRALSLLNSIFRGASVVYHLAAIPSVARSIRDPISSNEVNALGTLHVLLAARDCNISRVVFASSSSVYGDVQVLPKHEALPSHPQSPYAVTKMIGEVYCRLFYQLFDLKTVALRYFNVFGPRQDPNSEYAAVIPRFIARMRNGQPPIIYGDGNQTRDFTHVANAVSACLAAASAVEGFGEIYNVGCGAGFSLNELVRMLNQLLGTQLQPIYESPRAGDLRHSLASIEKISHRLGYRPAVPFRDGLEKTIRWYTGQGT